MSFYLVAFLIGIVAGLRAMTSPAAVSWAAYLGRLHLQGTWLAFLGFAVLPYLLTLAAVGEFVTDKLPSTPSRKIPVQFGARLATGALAGAAVGASHGHWPPGLVAGVIGAVAGTYGGAAGRIWLIGVAGAVPAGLIEDVIAVAIAFGALGMVA